MEMDVNERSIQVDQRNIQTDQLEQKEKLQIIYDHYKETGTLRREAMQRRNKNFVILCVLEAILFLFLIQLDAAMGAVTAGINSFLGVTFSLGGNVIQTLLWILIVYVLIRYCQDTLYVEGQYRYEDKLEKIISEMIKEKSSEENAVDREGENYFKDYPMVLNFIDLFYKMFSPILFAVINTVGIVKEWVDREEVSLSLVCDTALFIVVIIIIWFYFFEIHSKITGWLKKHIPLINTLSKTLRKILKEV